MQPISSPACRSADYKTSVYSILRRETCGRQHPARRIGEHSRELVVTRRIFTEVLKGRSGRVPMYCATACLPLTASIAMGRFCFHLGRGRATREPSFPPLRYRPPYCPERSPSFWQTYDRQSLNDRTNSSGRP